MLLIEGHLIERVFSPDQKRQIIEKLTNAMVSIEGETLRGVTWVKTSGGWGYPRRATDDRGSAGSHVQ